MAQIYFYLDMIAIMREVRHLPEPDPIQAAVLADLAGIDGVGVQLRRDRRFIRDRDLYLLKGTVKSRFAIETPPVEETIERVVDIKPDYVVLVADHADTDTPFSSIDFHVADIDFRDVVARLKGAGSQVAFLIEPEIEQVKGASKSGADAVMLSAKSYAGARTLEDAQRELDRIDQAAQQANRNNMTVQAGPGITYKNVTPLAELGLIDEMHVGHALCSRAMIVGVERAIRDMRDLLRQSPTAG